MEEERRRTKRVYRGEAEWREILKQQERSGQNVRSFCRANGISASLFYKASCRYKAEPKSGQGSGLGFEELFTHIASEERNGESETRSAAFTYRVELDLGNGVCLRIR